MTNVIRVRYSCYRQTGNQWQPVGRDRHGEHVQFTDEAAARRYAKSLGDGVRVFYERRGVDGTSQTTKIET